MEQQVAWAAGKRMVEGDSLLRVYIAENSQLLLVLSTHVSLLSAFTLMKPLYPLLKMLFPNYVTTTECVGRAMLSVTKRGFLKPVLENRDINQMCGKES